MTSIETPVALFVYNRLGETKQVFEQIATVKPSRLLVVADGPKKNSPRDEEKCNRVRSYIESNIDWDCTLKTNYASENLGLFDRFVTGLRWIFENEREAIILEDDCVPNESFFKFSQVMLDKYRDDKRVMDISGTNYLGTWKPDKQDYHFSFYGGIWGWATWRRSWQWYDPEMKLWESNDARERVHDVIADKNQARYLDYILDRAYNQHHTWDYPWGFARLLNSAHSIVPSKNLVSNVGFADDATNTTDPNSPWNSISRHQLDFPLDFHDYVAVDREYDKQFHKMRPVSHRYGVLRRARKVYERVTEHLGY